MKHVGHNRNSKQAYIERLIMEQEYDQVGLELPSDSEFVGLEEAGLEEDSNQQPEFGNPDNIHRPYHFEGGVQEYVEWFSDGEDSRYDYN